MSSLFTLADMHNDRNLLTMYLTEKVEEFRKKYDLMHDQIELSFSYHGAWLKVKL